MVTSQNLNHWLRITGSIKPLLGVAVLLSLLAAFLTVRLLDIEKYSLDSDETFTLRMVTQDVSRILVEARADKMHPPLYYLAVHAWVGFGQPSEYWIRLFSVLASSLGLLGLVLLCRELKLSLVYAAYGVAFVTVNDLLVFYADHARMYGLLATESAFSQVSLFRWLNTPTRRAISAYSVVVLILTTTHYFGWLLIAAHGCLIAIWYRSRIRSFSISLAPAATVSGAWMLYVLFGPKRAGEADLAGHLVGWLAKPNLKSLLGFLVRLSGGSDSDKLLAAASGLTCIIVIGSAIWLSRNRIRGHRDRLLTQLLLCCFLPPAIAFVLSSVVSGVSVWHQRYLIIAVFPYVVLLLYAIHLLPHTLFRRTAAATVLLLSCLTLVGNLRRADRKLQWGQLAAYISERGPKSQIFVLDPYVENAFLYYLSKNRVSGPVELAHLETLPSQGVFWIEYNRSVKPTSFLPEHSLRSRGYDAAAPHCIATPYEAYCVSMAWFHLQN